MDGTAVPIAGEPAASGVLTIHRSSLRYLVGLVREPLSVIPAQAYTARLVTSRIFGRLCVHLSDPALIHEAIVRHADHLEKTEDLKRVLGPALGDGLLTADGPVWRWQRQTLAPAFQHERLTGLLPAMIAAAEAARDRLSAQHGSVVDLGHEMMRTTFEIIVDTMLSGPEGIDAARVERSMSDYLGATSWMFALAVANAPRWCPYPGRGRAAAASRFMRTTIAQRVAARRAAGAGADDLLSMLLAARDPDTGRAMTDAEITDNIHTFIAAGHETTAIALSWTFALLASHPACLARMIDEIRTVTGDGPVRPEHIAALTYTRQVASEAMRLYPPAPLIARTVTRDMDLAGVSLPVGTTLFVPIYAIHRHASLWPQPKVFDPDRFAPEAVRARHRFAFMPFGAGPRICIGNAFAMMEAVAILAVLAKALHLQPADAALPEPQMRVTLRPAKPLRMRVSAHAAA